MYVLAHAVSSRDPPGPHGIERCARAWEFLRSSPLPSRPGRRAPQGFLSFGAPAILAAAAGSGA